MIKKNGERNGERLKFFLVSDFGERFLESPQNGERFLARHGNKILRPAANRGQLIHWDSRK